MDVPDWLELLALLHDLPERHPGLDGIVLTHGTSTLEETAYFLHLACRLDIPVVLVGAQRPASAFGSDRAPTAQRRPRRGQPRRAAGVLVVLTTRSVGARRPKTSILRVPFFRTPVSACSAMRPTASLLRRPTRRHAPDAPVRGRRQTGCRGSTSSPAMPAPPPSGHRRRARGW
jgi:L-asparaginase